MTRTPYQPCVHIHGVSVGEIQSAISLIDRIRKDLPDLGILLTCWTPTSRAMAEKNYGNDPAVTIIRLPVDLPWNHGPFFKAHNIKVSLWIDSEIWPGWLMAFKKRKIPVMIVNGRMSGKSYSKWSKVKPLIKSLLGLYARIDAQSVTDAAHFIALGGKAEVQPVNLKYLRPPLTVDQAQVALFQNSIGTRKVIQHAMTHPGDEDMAFDLHNHLKKDYPDLLTVIIPRHPHRAKELMIEARNKGLKSQLKSESTSIAAETDIFFGDTMGETGLYYALSPIVIMGKSFDPDHKGGQSPIEAGHMGRIILCGPYMTNFPAIMEDFHDADAILEVADYFELQEGLHLMLKDIEKFKTLGENARALCEGKLAAGPSYLASVIDFIKNGR